MSGLQLVAEAAGAGHLPALRELGLRDGQLRSNDMSTLEDEGAEGEEAAWLRTVVQCCAKLRHLDVRGCVGSCGHAPAPGLAEVERLQSLHCGFLLPALFGSGSGSSHGPTAEGLCIPSRLVELRLGLGARVNDAHLCALAASSSASSLKTLELAYSVRTTPLS